MKPFEKNIFLLNLILLLTITVVAQDPALTATIPVDSAVRIGELENGMRYYIRKNDKPENRAELRLVVNAGSILETDAQQGLAHFVEHMCFNGTEHFEKNELLHYLQSVGVQFGPDINGYTSFDETVYMLTVPTDSADIYNNAMLIMSDWAGRVTFDHDEIDKERGVIMEEWRMGRGAGMRMLYQYLPVLFKDSQYAKRLPIGTKEVIQHAPYDTLIQFYTDWYRPDLMAFIVVGDINLDETEKKITENFSELVAPENPKLRKEFQVPDNNHLLVSVVSDPENPYTNISLFYKHDVQITETMEDLRESLKIQLIIGMINQRLEELKEQENPPFMHSYVYFGTFWARSVNALVLAGYVNEAEIEKGTYTLSYLAEQVKKHGFTSSELERYKKMMLKSTESKYNERDKTESASYASDYIDHFLKSTPIPGIASVYEYTNTFVPDITLAEINQLARELFGDSNRVAVVQGIEKDGVEIPDEVQIKHYIDSVNKVEVEAYKDAEITGQLVSGLPAPGTVTNIKIIDSIGLTECVLSNGVRVRLKPTDFKNDEILFEADSKGGQSLYPAADHYSASYAEDIINESGIGGFSKSEIKKLLAGKKVGVTPYISTYYEGIKGSCSPRDIETMFELIYLAFTQPYVSDQAFNSFVSRQKSITANLLSEPRYAFSDAVARITSGNHPRAWKFPRAEHFDQINPDRVLEIYTERFADANDFTFTFVGAFSVDSIQPLLEKYIATLPVKPGTENYKDMGIRMPRVYIDTAVYKGSEPKAYVSVSSQTDADFNQDYAHLLWSLGEYLQLKFIDILREELSGVYASRVSCSMQNIPFEHSELQILIPCSPENTDTLTQVAINLINEIKENGGEEEYIEKVKIAQTRNHEKELKENPAWLNNLVQVERRGENYDRLVNYQRLTNLITPESLQRVATDYIDTENFIRVMLLPE